MEAAEIVGGVLARVRDSRGELIIFTQDTHQADYLQTPEGKKLPVPHCIEGSEGWRINQEIMDAWRNNTDTIVADELNDNTVTKPVFGSVRLVEFLSARQAEIKGIELMGLCTDICVVSNAIMLKNSLPDIPISLAEACCAGVTPKSHNEAVNTMRMCQIDIV